MNTTKKLLLLLLSVLITTAPTLSLTHVSGEVSGTWTVEDEPYYVDAAISIASRDSLTIEPGVTVRFSGRYGFTITGVLLALGTTEDSIVFRSSNPQPDAWLGIIFNSIRAGSSRMDFCSIKYAYRGITFSNSSPQVSNTSLVYHESNGMRFERSRAVVENCAIININGQGISILEQANPIITGCTISGCEDNGIAISEGSAPRIINNYITAVNDNGISISNAAPCSLRSNRIYRCGLRGISISETNQVVLVRNKCCENGDPGLWIFRSNNIVLLNNTFNNNSESGVYLYTSSAVIINNIICSNDQDGIYAQGANPQMSYNCVWGNGRENYNGTEAGRNDINVSPLLDVNYDPRENSPVIDAGDPRYRDLDNTRADIGAGFFNQNLPPVIITTSPESFDSLVGDQAIEFTAYAEDPNAHQLTYTWFLNGAQIGEGNTVEIFFNRNDDYIVRILIDDGYYMGQTIYDWSFTAYNMFVPDVDDAIPGTFTLSAPYPNPFNSTAQFDVKIRHKGIAKVFMYNSNGRVVQTIWNQVLLPGLYRFPINAMNLPAGNYIINLFINDKIKESVKVIKK